MSEIIQDIVNSKNTPIEACCRFYNEEFLISFSSIGGLPEIAVFLRERKEFFVAEDIFSAVEFINKFRKDPNISLPHTRTKE